MHRSKYSVAKGVKKGSPVKVVRGKSYCPICDDYTDRINHACVKCRERRNDRNDN